MIGYPSLGAHFLAVSSSVIERVLAPSRNGIDVVRRRYDPRLLGELWNYIGVISRSRLGGAN